ncbi:hypothetical protein OEZ86_010204 [Tetradesmus obliquus]|nr:hypothetical protein OEZ86_010204 [Tetradesmus obliquus]
MRFATCVREADTFVGSGSERDETVQVLSGDNDDGVRGWKKDLGEPSLPESYASISVPPLNAPVWKKLLAFSGMGLLISVGYMDPGNWATDIAGGAKFGYTLLSVVMLSSLVAMFLQHMALKLGVATNRDLAQCCRDAYWHPVNIALWILAEIGIAACDMAEVIGSAVAIRLLSAGSIPLWACVLITGVDVALVIIFELRSFRILEVFIGLLIFSIFGCFVYEMAVSSPNWKDVAWGLVPQPMILTNYDMLFVAIGIMGATVMPHNLYLHSSIVQTRNFPRTTAGRKFAIKYGTIDSSISLAFAFFINAAILILAGATFHYSADAELRNVADISDAYQLLSPTLGASAASTIFAVALLLAGLNATVTATLAGQVVMEGFLRLKLKPWIRRLITRGLALAPALVVAAVMGDRAVGKLLLVSQVVLSLQLSFAVVPLVHFTSCKKFMGKLVNSWLMASLAGMVALVIAGLNMYLLVSVFINPTSFSQDD